MAVAPWGTGQTPFVRMEDTRAWLSGLVAGAHLLAACVEGEVVGARLLKTFAAPIRRRRTEIGRVAVVARQSCAIASRPVAAAIKRTDDRLNVIRLERPAGISFGPTTESRAGDCVERQHSRH